MLKNQLFVNPIMDTLTLAIFFLASVILLLGFAGQVIFKKTSIPDIIWLLLLGVMLSFLLGPAQKSMLVSFAGPFGALALIMILFNSGMEFDLIAFSQGVFRGTLLTLVAFLFTAIVTAGVTSAMLGWPLMYGLLLGVAVGGTSSGVIVPIVTRLKISDYLKSILTVESTATDIFVIVFAIAILDVLQTGTTDILTAFKSITAAFSIGITIGLVGALLWLFLLREIEKEVRSYLLDFTIVLLLYVFTEFIGGAGAIAALTFGLVLGNIHTIRKVIKIPEEVRITRGEKIFYSELNFFIRSFFFVYLGVMFDFSNLAYLGIGLLLVLLFLFVRMLAVYISMFRTNVTEKEKNFMSIMMARGLAAAVISQMPYSVLSQSVTDEHILMILRSFSPIVLAVILFSIIATVVGVYFLGRDLPKGQQKQNIMPGSNKA